MVAGSGINPDYVHHVDMNYSSNWAYILNNMNLNIHGNIVERSGTKGFEFEFYNLRIKGPYFYVLETPLLATIPTYNADNNGYNIVAMSYNEAEHHNSLIRMCSSMEIVTNDLSNFRVRLLNDQWEVVRIHEPLNVWITVTNEG